MLFYELSTIIVFKTSNVNFNFILCKTIWKTSSKEKQSSFNMKINKAFRYEIKPNVQSRILCAKSAGTARFVYNWALQKRVDLYALEKKSINAIEQHRLLNSLKATDFPWMYEVSKCSAQEALRDLNKASRKHSRKKKGSKNRKKSAFKLSRLHRKIQNKRKDFLHKESTKLAKTKSVIVLEDLNVKKMLENNKYSRNISEAGWGEFRCMLEYKTKWYGSKLII